MRAVRPLGSSSGLIFSSLGLQRLMEEILEVFRSNAASIYVTFGEKADTEIPAVLRARGHFPAMSQYIREFPELLTELSQELREFLDSFAISRNFQIRDFPIPLHRSRDGSSTEPVVSRTFKV